MSRMFLFTLAALGVGFATLTAASTWRRTLVTKRVEQPERVGLAGLASIELPPSFKPVGRGRDGSRSGKLDENLDRHRDDYQITFRFEQAQHHGLGGHLADPVLLHVTLFNPNAPRPDASKITFTTIPRFYPPVDDDRPRLDAHFAAQRWLPDVRTGDAVTRAAATGEGRGDDLVSGPPERWLVIHVDETRRIRIDLYTWRKMYSVDEARALVKHIAESVAVTPKLSELFEGVKGIEARESERFDRSVTSALATLSRCGVRSMGPAMVSLSDRCASWLSDDRRFLRVARPVGRIPLAAATGRWQDAPEFKIVVPAGRSPKLQGPVDFRLAMIFWDDKRKGWAVGGFGEHLHEDDDPESPLIAAITRGLRDHASVHLFALASHDLQYLPDRVALDEFFAEADRVATALRDGKVVAGVTVAPLTLEQR
ncbi:MAG: hypothetical protein ABIP93_02595 [Gemmatimonadaceae bacterium]